VVKDQVDVAEMHMFVLRSLKLYLQFALRSLKLDLITTELSSHSAMEDLAKPVAMLLSQEMHDSQYAIAMDDLVVISLFAAVNPDSQAAHTPQILGRSFDVPGEALVQLYEAFEGEKKNFDLKNGKSFGDTALAIRHKLVRDRNRVYYRRLSVDALAVLRW
jgi:hypothetical protein